MVSIRRRVLILGLIGAGLVGCEVPPDVLPKGTAEEQAEAVRAVLRRVVEGLAAGQERSLMEQGLIFLPLRWRKQQKEYQELEALGRQLAGRQNLVLGEVRVDGRWALVEYVLADGERIGPSDAPWFLLYFSGQWRWLPASIMKDQAVVGMMDSHFDRLWAGWQASHRR
ncbi:MAG: hypothetical protein ABWU16_04615 [Halothiobacillaceae bacterium]